MPADMRLILAACYELNVHDLAAKADSIFMFSSESVPANTNLLDCRPTTNFNVETASSTVMTQTLINSNLQSQIYTMADELRNLKRSVGISCASNQPRPSYLNPRSDCKETYQSARSNLSGASLFAPVQGMHAQQYRPEVNPQQQFSKQPACDICYYHSMFGSKAYRCRQPSSFNEEKNGGSPVRR